MAGIGLPDGQAGGKGHNEKAGGCSHALALKQESAKSIMEDCEAGCWGLGQLLKAFDGEALDQRAVHGLGHIVAGFSTDLESALAEIETFSVAIMRGYINRRDIIGLEPFPHSPFSHRLFRCPFRKL